MQIELPRKEAAEIRQEQLNNPEFKKIIDAYKQLGETKHWISRGYLVSKRVLYRYFPDDDTEKAQLVVPGSERKQMFYEFHDAPTAGHYKVDHTYTKNSLINFYWPEMRQDIKNYIRQYGACQQYKVANTKPTGQIPVLHQKFEVILIDLFSQLPEELHGKTWMFNVENCTSRWVDLLAVFKHFYF